MVDVEGVRFADGSRLGADLVVDAAGRLSRFGAWLSEAGAARPTETAAPCGIAYYSRFYRRAEATAPLPTALNRGHTVGASYDRYSCLVFPADNDTFSVTFGVLPEDAALRVLRHGPGFDAAVRAVPTVAPWLDEPGVVPLGEVAAMSGLNNRVRLWTDEAGRAVARGVLPVGDAALITNPAHTRGTTLALLSAIRLAAVVAATRDAEERVGAAGGESACRLPALVRGLLRPGRRPAGAMAGERTSRPAAVRPGRPARSVATEGDGQQRRGVPRFDPGRGRLARLRQVAESADDARGRACRPGRRRAGPCRAGDRVVAAPDTGAQPRRAGRRRQRCGRPCRRSAPGQPRMPDGGRALRIAMLTYSTRPRGGVVATLELAEALVRAGHRSTSGRWHAAATAASSVRSMLASGWSLCRSPM